MDCPCCESDLQISGYRCHRCGVSLSGDFEQPALARLSSEHARTAELLLLHAGHLRAVADELAVSHPTARKRVAEAAAALRALRASDEDRIDALLRAIEEQRIDAEEGARRIREIRNA